MQWYYDIQPVCYPRISIIFFFFKGLVKRDTVEDIGDSISNFFDPKDNPIDDLQVRKDPENSFTFTHIIDIDFGIL